MPRLRILAGPSLTNLTPISANTGKAFHVVSDTFEGDVAVYIKNFATPSGEVPDSAYFEQEERKDVTWSIQVQGRFLQEYSADDILFGNVFDKPLPIPWGFSAITSFMSYVDPTLEQDLQSKTKPWALSPLISTMTYLAHTRVDELHNVPPFPPIKPLKDDTSQLRFKDGKKPEGYIGDSEQGRRAYFKDAESRKSVTFGPNDLITADFCYGYLSFSPDGAQLSLPGGFSLDLMKHWDGQPIHFVCCARAPRDATGTGRPLAKIFWCVSIEVLGNEDNGGNGSEAGGQTAAQDSDDID